MINLFAFARENPPSPPNGPTGNITDASLYYLGRIFGNMFNVIPQSTNPMTGEMAATGNINLISTVFGVFNGVILTVAALMVVYITITGTLITAHEGEFMGKKYHQIWTPIRTVMGIAALVPIAGYSLIQYVMMWVIVQGIGAADMLWYTAWGYIGVTGSAYAQISVPATQSSSAIYDIFKGLVCEASARHGDPSNVLSDHGNYYCAVKGISCPISEYSVDKSTFEMGPSGLCGTLHTCDVNNTCSVTPGSTPTNLQNDLTCKLCNAQVTTVGSIIDELRSIANKLVEKDYQYRLFWVQSKNILPSDNGDWRFISDYCHAKNIPDNQCCIPGSNVLGFPTTGNKCQATGTNSAFYDVKTDSASASPEAVAYIYWNYGLKPDYTGISTDFMNTLVTEYTTALNKIYEDYLKDQSALSKNLNSLPDIVKKALQRGWIFAGSYFYVMSQNNTATTQTIPDISVDPQASDDQMKDRRNNLDAASVLADMAAGNPPQQNATVGNTTKTLNQGFKDMGNVLGTINNSTSNPIAQMQQVGFSLLMIVQYMFLAMMILAIVAAIPGYLSGFAAGFGIINPVGPAQLIASLFIIPAVFALFGVLIAIGGLLGVYVPLIPYIIFTFGAIGWFVSVLEAMVAGPLVALGILSPSAQHHEILGKAEPALGLLFSIFLRPSLMVFGFLASILLASVVADMINTAFWTVVAAGIASGGISAGGKPLAGASGAQYMFFANPLEGILFISAYVAIIVAAMNKSFSPIHVIPEQVLNWISLQTAQRGGGEEALLGEAKSRVAGTGAAAHGVLGKGKEGAGQVGGAARTKREAAEKGKRDQMTADQSAKPPGQENPPETK